MNPRPGGGMKPSSCLECRHFNFSGGDRGYSEMTPGSDMSIGCGLGKWDAREMMAEEFRVAMKQAGRCGQFEEFRPESEAR